MTVWVFRLRSFSCLRTKSAESWSLKGRTIRTVGFSFGVGNGCGSSTLEAINDLTVELIRCCGYFSREKLLSDGHILQKNTANTMISDMHGQAWFSKALVYIAWQHGSGSGAKDLCQ